MNWMNRIAGGLKSFHNSTPIHGNELQEAEAKARTQDEQVIEMIEKYDGIRLITPEKIHELLVQYYPNYANTPQTSIRRSFSNLSTTKGGNVPKIEKTGEKVTGMYGAKINVWKLKK